MAKTIPCPNPICTHSFSLADLQAASQLLCPKCGFRMAGKGAAAPKPAPALRPKAEATLPPGLIAAKKPAAPSPPKPATAPAVPVPASGQLAMATPVTAPASTTPITATPVAAAPPPGAANSKGSMADGSFFNPGVDAPTGPLLRSREQKKKSIGGIKLLIAAAVVGILVIGGITVVGVTVGLGQMFSFLLGGEGARTAAGPEGSVYFGKLRNAKGESESVYKLVLHQNDWALDKEIKSSFNAHAAWKSKEQDFWFAIVVKDFGMFKPRDAEMLRYGIDRLQAHFGENLELAAKSVPAKIGDLPAQRLQFKGQVTASRWLGDCYMFFKDGIGYWLFMASPDAVVLDQFAAELPEKNFFVITERRGWREQPPAMDTWTSSSGKLAVTVPKGMWEKYPNAKDEDERGDLLLFGRYQKEKDNTKNAQVLVFTLDPQKDLQEAMKAARAYLDKKQMSGDNNTSKIVPVGDAKDQPEGGILDNVGNRRGRLIDLKLQFNDEPKRFYLLAVINDPDVAYVILCQCAWESRQIWRQEFLDLLGTLNVRKGE